MILEGFQADFEDGELCDKSTRTPIQSTSIGGKTATQTGLPMER